MINQDLTCWAAGVLLYLRLPAHRRIAFTSAKGPIYPTDTGSTAYSLTVAGEPDLT